MTPPSIPTPLVAAHTPGPWEHGDVLYQRDFRTFVNVVSDSQSAFVACVSADPMHRDTILANARVVIAAPELLSVVLDLFENPQFVVSIGGNPIMVDALVDRARAAIAKATGR